ncbi:MAG: SRPBCC family protein [Acidimicrobiales bacterium]
MAERPTLSHDLNMDPAESEDWTMAEKSKPVEVSRRIEAPAALIFKLLANPQRHADFDGSGMLRGADIDRPISDVGDIFSMKMHRLGDDYLMINYVVEFEPDRRIFWEPAPGDPSRAEDNDPSKVGIPAGYRWGYILTPDGDDITVVTEVFDPGPLPENLLRDGGEWINGSNPVLASMAASLERLEKISTE